MAIDISDLAGKVENEGKTPQGRVAAEEWNRLIAAIIGNQGGVKSVRLNGSTFMPDENGMIDLVVSESNYLLNLTTTVAGSAPYRIALGTSFMVSLGVSNKYQNGDEQISVTTRCTARVLVNDVEVETLDVYDGNTYDIDVGRYLSEGTNRFYIEVDNGYGVRKQTLAYEVTAVNIGVSLPYWADAAVMSGDWAVDVRLSGSVTGNVHVAIDGEEVVSGTQSAGSVKSYPITTGKSYGIHRVTVWAEYAEDADIRTDVIEKEYIYQPAGASGVVIGCDLKAGTRLAMYNTLTLGYWIVNPGASGEVEVSLSIIGENNAVLAGSVQTVTLEDGLSSLQTWSVALFGETMPGDRTVRIECGGVRRNIAVTIVAGEVVLSEVAGADVVLRSSGKSNNDQDRAVWNGGGVSVDLSALDFTAGGSGWAADSDGNVALHLKKGQYLTIPVTPFDENPAMGNGSDVAGTRRGLTVSIELATRNCVRADAVVAECMYSGIGFQFKANGMTFSSDSESLSCDYKEDTRVRIDMVIEGTQTEYTWTDDQGAEQHSLEALMLVYIDGVYQAMRLITPSTSFKQGVAQPITVGSAECDVDLYCVRMYRSTLDRRGIVQNYAYDTPKVADKIAIAKRNDVLDSNLEVSYPKLIAARPELPVLVLQAEAMPTSKTAIPLQTSNYTNPLNPDDFEAGNASFTSSGDTFKCQGTSSMNYPVPFRNLDMSFNNVTVGGASRAGWRMYAGEPLSNDWTAKKDYASSEMANNAIMSMLYNKMCVALGADLDTLTEAQRVQYQVRQQLSDVTYRQSLMAVPIFVFRYWDNTYYPIGMFNLITSKNNEKVLGFEGAYTWERSGAQAWEIRDNNVMWDTVFNAMSWDSERNAEVNDIYNYYEARYPKIIKENGAKRDFGHAENAGQTETVQAETAGLLRLHNWLVSTNQKLATGGLLATPYTDSKGVTYAYDTAAYRLAKFISEASDYISVDHWCVYLIWMLVNHMMDNGSKNLGLCTYNGSLWRPLARDTDSGLGIGNTGRIEFPFWLGLSDYIVNGRFVYDQPSQPAGSSTVFNGQRGAIWVNLKDGYDDRIQAIAKMLYDKSKESGFSGPDLIAWFERHQGAWCEALYNYGMKQYQGGTPYSRWIESGLGDKKNQRRYWLGNSFRYWGSRWALGSEGRRITWRTWGYGCDLVIKPYMPMWVCLGLGNYQYSDTVRYRCLDPEQGVTVVNSEVQHGMVIERNDNVTYLFDGDLLTDIGDLYKYGDIGDIDLGVAVKLRSLRLGSNTDRQTRQWVNTKLTELNVTNAVSLEVIDLTNCEGLGSKSNGVFTLDLSKQEQLRELYLWGSGVTGVTLPKTTTLTTLVFGRHLKTLRLIDCTSVSTLEMEGYGSLESIIVQNTPIVDTLAVVRGVHASAPGQLREVRIDNVNWRLNGSDGLGLLDALAALGSNCRLSGTITLTGASVSFERKRRWVVTWGDVDHGSQGLTIVYNRQTVENVAITTSKYMPTVGDYPLEITSEGNNFTAITWSMPSNEWASVNAQTGVVTVNRVGTEANPPIALVTVTLTLHDGSTVTASKELHFHEHSCKEGDLVYADGSFSDEYLPGKTVVGVCMYINPDDPTDRLAYGLANLVSDQWGLHPDRVSGVTLDSGEDYNCYDVPAISNITAVGTNTINDANYRDEAAGDAQGFKIFSRTTAVGDMGMVQLEENLGPYKAGDFIHVGQFKTLHIIRHRNKILNGVTLDGYDLSAPIEANAMQSETEVLQARIDAIVAAKGNNYREFYFPAASRCYAYEPKVKAGEVLSDKFKAHRWWLPSAGELARMVWWHLQGYDTANEKAIFAKAFALGLWVKPTDWQWSTTEFSASYAYNINAGSGAVYNYNNKGNSYGVRAVVAF
ncbi:MAG: hypothetical protein KBT13_07410 [Bacteroidales bacterium]|nr:hypothetical protein [Candidatus Sodaliphilus limicaballi]